MIDLKVCPRCHATCQAVGEMLVGGETLPVMECPRCVARKEIFGEEFEVALLYIVLANGTLVEPEELSAAEALDELSIDEQASLEESDDDEFLFG
jgi:hypothetical protein